jgi:glutaredoxin 3
VATPPSFPLPESFSSPVVVYLTPWCPYCRMATRLLDSKKIRYSVFDVSGNNEAREWLRKHTGQHTVPQIFLHQKSVGGYTELAALDSQGGLAAGG